MKAIKRTLMLSLGLLALSGCPSYLTMQSTRTVEPGQVELSAAMGRSATFGGSSSVGFGSILAPTQLEGALRFGIVPGLDLGVRLRLADLGVSAGAKWRPLNLEKFQLALMGEIGTSIWAPILNAISSAAHQRASVAFFWFDLAAAGGIPVAKNALIFFGPKVKVSNYSLSNVDSFFGGTGGSGTVSTGLEMLQPGFVVGGDIDTGAARVLPEIDIHYDLDSRQLLVQVGLTAALGGHKEKKKPRPAPPAPSPPTPASEPPASPPAPAPGAGATPLGYR